MKEKLNLETKERYNFENDIFEKLEKEMISAMMQDTDIIARYGFVDRDFESKNSIMLYNITRLAAKQGYSKVTLEILNEIKVNTTLEWRLDDMVIRGIERLISQTITDFDAKYIAFKKFTLLRSLYRHGVDIGNYYQDYREGDLKTPELNARYENFCNATVDDIKSYYSYKIDDIYNTSGYHRENAIEPCDMRLLPHNEANDIEIIEGLLLNETVNVVVGGPKNGKSFFTEQLAYCVEHGLPFLGHETTKSKTLIIDYELSYRSLIHRGNSLADIYGIEECPETICFGNNWNSSITLDYMISFVKRYKEQHPDLRLVIFDPFYRFHTGDENSAADVAKTLSKFKVLTNDMSIIYVHHTTKSGVTGTALSAGSGSGVHGRFVDQQYLIKPKDKALELCVNGRDFDGITIDIRRPDDLHGFFEVYDKRHTLGDIANTPVAKPKITKEDLKEKYPEICKVIDENVSCPTTLKHLKDIGFDFKNKDLTDKGFIYDRDKQRFKYPD